MNMKEFGNDIIIDKNFTCVFSEDKVFLIPTFNEDKPIKVYFENEYNIEETEDGLCVTKKISIEEAIRKVKAAGNNPDEFIDVLLKDGKWTGKVC
nr:MAG TPA: hypothetical protein [Caudoviricetes sp.]